MDPLSSSMLSLSAIVSSSSYCVFCYSGRVFTPRRIRIGCSSNSYNCGCPACSMYNTSRWGVPSYRVLKCRIESLCLCGLITS